MIIYDRKEFFKELSSERHKQWAELKNQNKNKEADELVDMWYDEYMCLQKKLNDDITIIESTIDKLNLRDNSITGKEFSLVIKFVNKGKDFKYIDNYLSNRKIKKEYNKWLHSPKQYKTLLYQKAIERYEALNKYETFSLDECKDVLQKWLHIEDDNVIDIIFAFSLGEKLPGDPLWLFLIAPPGGSKTEQLRAMKGREYYHLSDLTSKTFISGLMQGKGEEQRKVEDLLPQLNKKILILKDFTTILEKGREERREIISQFREIYDGFFGKKFGTIDEKIEYNARFGMIAAVTPIIDKHWKVMQQLGERFLKYRIKNNPKEATYRSMKNEGQETEMRDNIHKAVMGFLSNLKIPNDIDFPEKYNDDLYCLASFVAICRTPIMIQSNQSDFFYDYIPTPEVPTRIVKQIKKFCKCISVVRDNPIDDNTIKLAARLCSDTCPQDRIHVILAVSELEHMNLLGCTTTAVASKVNIPETSVRRILQQLKLLNIVAERTEVIDHGTYTTNISYYKNSESEIIKKVLPFLKDIHVPRSHKNGGSKKVGEGYTSKNDEVEEINLREK